MDANPGYGLRIVGHSLGAGVAAVLGLMLRKQYPNLYCLCFSPPGCVFTERTARESKDFVCSYVLHNDIVPRLSYNSLVNLRNDLIECIARLKVPKHEVFEANWKPWNEKSVLSLTEKHLHGVEEIPRSQFLIDFETFKQKQEHRLRNVVNMVSDLCRAKCITCMFISLNSVFSFVVSDSSWTNHSLKPSVDTVA